MVQLSVDHICVESMNDSQLDGHQQMTNLLNVVVDDESDSDLNGIPDYVLNLSDEDDESSDNSLHSTSPVTLRMKDKRHRSTRPMGIIDKFNTDHFPESTKLLPLSPESPVITRLKNYISSTRIGQNLRKKDIACISLKIHSNLLVLVIWMTVRTFQNQLLCHY